MVYYTVSPLFPRKEREKVLSFYTVTGVALLP